MATIINILSSRKLGGLEEAYMAYTRALVAGGHRVVMLAHPKALILHKLKQIRGAELRISRLFSSTFSRKNPLAHLAAYLLCRELRPDWVMIHNNRTLGLFSRTIMVNHGYAPEKTLAAERIICVNSALAKATQALGKEDVHVIHNAIEELPIPAPKQPNNTPVIGFMGRFAHQKGVDIFVQALAQLDGVDFLAKIAGGGELEGNIRGLIDQLGLVEKVQLVGWAKDKHQFYEQLDIFCTPSRHEGFGLVILEAMAHGLPVISTRCDGPQDIITHDVDGVLLPPEDIEALAAKIKILIENASLRASLGQNARETVENKFSFPAFVRSVNVAIN